MSHITEIKLYVRNLFALQKAGEALGMELTEAKTYKWWGRWMRDSPLPQGVKEEDLGKCNYKLSIPNNKTAYEVGIVQQPDGSFSLCYDFYSGGYGLEKVIGKEACNLVQEYSAQVAIMQAQLDGMEVISRSVNEEGELILEVQ